MVRGSRLLLSLALSFCSAFTFSCTDSSDKPNDQTAVQINDRRLTLKEFADQLALNLREADVSLLKNSRFLNNAKEQVLENFLIEALTAEEAEDRGIHVSQDEIDQALETLQSQYPDKVSFQATIAKNGLTKKRLRQSLKAKILRERVMESLSQDIPEITEEELKKAFQEQESRFRRPEAILLQQIVLPTRAGAEKVLKTIKSKKMTFSEAAKKYSVAPEATNGGRLGWVELGTLEVFDEVFQLKKKTLSEVKKSPYGWHILTVLDKRPARSLSFNEVRTQVSSEILEQRKQSVFTEWIDRKLRSARVYENDDLIKKISIEAQL